MECATPEIYPKTSVEDEAERRCTKQDDVQAILPAKAAEAKTRGLAPAEAMRLHDLFAKHIDVFREDLGDDPPVEGEPLEKEVGDLRMTMDGKPINACTESIDVLVDAKSTQRDGLSGRNDGVHHFGLDQGVLAAT
ncbi:hypothetical protein DYB35_013761 [Aphanomyces astaci]|uniref:Uncharacterized protein n=1 Tax=Aphanomyces astaci TaxID=112090 RepID=A0A418CV39_APHAT|nr:hypothetical protein DYB35_013761 [Aphanomyces astaci]